MKTGTKLDKPRKPMVRWDTEEIDTVVLRLETLGRKQITLADIREAQTWLPEDRRRRLEGFSNLPEGFMDALDAVVPGAEFVRSLPPEVVEAERVKKDVVFRVGAPPYTPPTPAAVVAAAAEPPVAPQINGAASADGSRVMTLKLDPDAYKLLRGVVAAFAAALDITGPLPGKPVVPPPVPPPVVPKPAPPPDEGKIKSLRELPAAIAEQGCRLDGLVIGVVGIWPATVAHVENDSIIRAYVKRGVKLAFHETDSDGHTFRLPNLKRYTHIVPLARMDSAMWRAVRAAVGGNVDRIAPICTGVTAAKQAIGTICEYYTKHSLELPALKRELGSLAPAGEADLKSLLAAPQFAKPGQDFPKLR